MLETLGLTWAAGFLIGFMVGMGQRRRTRDARERPEAMGGSAFSPETTARVAETLAMGARLARLADRAGRGARGEVIDIRATRIRGDNHGDSVA